MKYEIDLDTKILNTIESEKDKKINISDLRNYIGIHSSQLEYHLEKLVEWNMISDSKPNGPGKARIISFVRPFDDCIMELVNLKLCTDKVNKYFPK